MRYKLADDARPQAMLLLVASVLTVGLWFVPYAEYLVYPIRLFVTFVHESSHAIVAFVTGGSVKSLTVAADTSGVVYSASTSFLGAIFTSSAGYLGTTIFGVLLLFLIRKSVSPHKVLFGCGVLLGLVTVFFGVLSPAWNIFSLDVGFSSIAFTVIVGAVLTAALLALAKFSSVTVANYAVAFLAAQCILNALSDLKTVLYINTPLVGSDMANDAANMAVATGIPAFLWVVIWIAISIVVIALGLRMFAAVRNMRPEESLFND